MPEWRRRLTQRQPTSTWWRRRHHCSDAVMGSNVQLHGVDTPLYTAPHDPLRPVHPPMLPPVGSGGPAEADHSFTGEGDK